MEDINTVKDFSNHSDEELMLREVIQESADLYFIHCCLGEALNDNLDNV